MIRTIAGAAIFACVAAAPSFSIAAADTDYDGSWNISIVTERGACERASFGVQITNGIVNYQGPGSLTGNVSAGGGVRVSVLAGDKQASGSGKLSQTSGSGRWSGRAGSENCSGTWTAQRF